LVTAFPDGARSCGAGWLQFADAATFRSRGAEKRVGQLFAKWAATYQVVAPLGRLIDAEVDWVVVAITAAAPELAIQRSYEVAFADADQVKLTGLATFDAPAAGAVGVGALLSHNGCALIVAAAVALLLFPFGSPVVAWAEALSIALPLAAAVAVMVSVAAGPGGSEGMVQTMVEPVVEHVQPFPDATGVVTPERLWARVTFCAAFGPLFATFRVKVTVPPALTGLGLAAAVRDRSAESAIVTVALPEAVHDPLATVTLRMAMPLFPAVQVIDGVPLPLMIVPPVIVQL
jgi:hypothetical protein